MTFPLGKPVLAMLAVALVSGGWLLVWPRAAPKGDLQVWVFAQPHAEALRRPVGDAPSLVELYRRRTSKSVRVELISQQAEALRLVSLFNADSRFVPDLAEVEIGSVGMFFRAPADEVGFLPLNDFLQREHLQDQFIPSRFAPYSKGKTIFGVPHDIHPVALVYRKDLFDQAGIDLASAATWDEFQRKCLAFQSFWRSRGEKDRWAIELPIATPDVLTQMLLQRHVNVVDNLDQVHLNHPRVGDTLIRYAEMVAGAERIGGQTSAGPVMWSGEFARGEVCALFCADWRIGDLKAQQPGLAGKCGLMPLPRFEADDAPTSTWGGTMIGIPRHCRDPEASWNLLKFLYLSPEASAARDRFTNILPPVKNEWDLARYGQPDPYFGGQKTGLLLIDMARQVPARHVSSHSLAGSQALSFALFRAVAYVREHGSSDGLGPVLAKELEELSTQLRERIEFGNAK
jgi:arabinosaccharide transport system substrate-binding protein